MTHDFATQAICHAAEMVMRSIQSAAAQYERPSVLLRPRLFLDGDMYCALYGDDLMSGCAGFGKTASEAYADFDRNWWHAEAPKPVHKCARCGEPNPERLDRDGCRDPECPEHY